MALQFAGLRELPEGRKDHRRRRQQPPVGQSGPYGELPERRREHRQYEPEPKLPVPAEARKPGLALSRGDPSGRNGHGEEGHTNTHSHASLADFSLDEARLAPDLNGRGEAKVRLSWSAAPSRRSAHRPWPSRRPRA